MKEYFIEFFKLLANCVMIVCFAFVSFLIIINIYHYSELNNAYDVNINDNKSYQDYKKTMKDVDKKMNSISGTDVSGTDVAFVYQEYKLCKNTLDKGSFNRLENNSLVQTKDIYDFNYDMINKYNKNCIFGIAYDLKTLSGKSFNSVYKKIDEKRKILLDSSESLLKSQLGNSSYNFSTYITRATIYDKVSTDFKVTMDNYNIMASILEDIANWYVSEYGGAYNE